MTTLDVNLLEKKLRAEVIKEYLDALGENRCVCFTCGNATKALRAAGVQVVSVGEQEELRPGRWYSYNEIAASFRCFDATSGHLPMPMLREIAERMRMCLGGLEEREYGIPTGSGETLVVLSMAYPEVRFIPLRYKGRPETRYNEGAPMNALVEALTHAKVRKSGEIQVQEKKVEART